VSDVERKVIHKYPIPSFNSEIQMPVGAEILTVQMQHDRPTIWASHWVGVQTEFRRFKIVATGQEFDPYEHGNMEYLGTVQVPSGLVWHVFEAGQR
jgi:hypothetical protein